jgi:hypothetical protein
MGPSLQLHYLCMVHSHRLISMWKYFLTSKLHEAEEVKSCSATQEITSILWGLKVHCRVHNTPPVIPVLKQMNSVHILQSYFFNTSFFSSQVHLGLFSGMFLLDFSARILYTYLPSNASYAPCPSYLFFNILIVSEEEYKIWRSCKFLQSSVASSPLDPNILLGTPSSATLRVLPLMWSDQVPHPYKTTAIMCSGSTKCCEILEKLTDWWLFKKDSTAYSTLQFNFRDFDSKWKDGIFRKKHS